MLFILIWLVKYMCNSIQYNISSSNIYAQKRKLRNLDPDEFCLRYTEQR